MPPVLKSFRTEDGSFQLDGLPVGPVQLLVSAPGYVQYRVPGLVLEEGKPVRDLEVALETGTKISGRVTGPDGKPVSDKQRDKLKKIVEKQAKAHAELLEKSGGDPQGLMQQLEAELKRLQGLRFD